MRPFVGDSEGDRGDLGARTSRQGDRSGERGKDLDVDVDMADDNINVSTQ